MTATRALAVACGYLAVHAAEGREGIEALIDDDDHSARTRISLLIPSIQRSPQTSDFTTPSVRPSP